MNKGRRSLRRAAVATAAFLVLLDAGAAPAGNGVTQRRDEFGIVPEEPHDKDLIIPDPVLDRTWPGPKPGEGHRIVDNGPEEDDERVPEPEEEPPARHPKGGGAAKDNYDARVGKHPPAVIGPDGHRDPGGPAPEIDPSLPDVLDKDAPDLSDLEREEGTPTPHARGGEPSGDEGDSGAAGE